MFSTGRFSRWLLYALSLLALAGTAFLFLSRSDGVAADPTSLIIDVNDQAVVDRGRAVYERWCASCHGIKLDGQPNWRERLSSGRMPAPPHNASGHTWHHPDAALFAMTKHGLVPGVMAPDGYESDMPAFSNTLTDPEIVAVLSYIKSTWPEEIRAKQREITARFLPR